jgi:hypothetical protein
MSVDNAEQRSGVDNQHADFLASFSPAVVSPFGVDCGPSASFQVLEVALMVHPV